jgi:hypothetical protein
MRRDKEIDMFRTFTSVQKRVEHFQKILEQYGVKEENRRRLIVDELFPFLIPPGIKAKYRGDVFNKIVKQTLTRKFGNKVLSFEKKLKDFQEIPDWILRKNGMTLVGYNQVDIWSGGHQVNRGGKYVMDDYFHRRMKRKNTYVICVVERSWPTKNTKRQCKVSVMIDKGRRTLRLCHVNELIETCQKIMKEHSKKKDVTQQSQQRRSVRRRR